MWKPPTPFERRMTELSRLFPPPPSHPLHNSVAARSQFEGERDLAIRIWVQDLAAKFPSFILSRVEGGTNFAVSHDFLAFDSTRS